MKKPTLYFIRVQPAAVALQKVFEEVVKAFQLRHGLNDDGVAGPKTLEALNTDAETRLRLALQGLGK